MQRSFYEPNGEVKNRVGGSSVTPVDQQEKLKSSVTPANNGTDHPAKRKVFIVEDHPVVRDFVRLQINEQEDMTCCGEADVAASALDGVLRTQPDLIVVDISLKAGRSGLEFIKDVRAVLPRLRAIVFSMHDEALFAERALRAGAEGYVSKLAPSATLIAAIRRVLAGDVFVSQEASDSMVKHFIRGNQATGASAVERLTDRELEIFHLIGRGRTSRQIATELRLDPKTVETYRGRIKTKLGLASATALHQQAFQWTVQGTS